MDIQDFQKEVIERSFELPVLADFWADWCGPCKMLAPVLESLAEAARGTWELAKVNVDAHPEAANQYGVRGIPAVKLFSKGEVIAEFSGALPQPQIESWLDEHLPSDIKNRLEQAEAALANLKFADAIALGRAVGNEDLSASLEKRLAWLMGRALCFVDVEETQTWLQKLGPNDIPPKQFESVQFLADWLISPPDIPTEEADLAQSMESGVQALGAGDIKQALDSFTGILWEKPNFADGQVKRLTLAIFHLLGMRHPLSEQHFRAYSAATNS